LDFGFTFSQNRRSGFILSPLNAMIPFNMFFHARHAVKSAMAFHSIFPSVMAVNQRLLTPAPTLMKLVSDILEA
jgi:hypothetical protein